MLPLKTILEGLLFTADSPLSAEKLASAFEEPVSQQLIVRTIDELIYEYEEMGRAFTLKLVAGGYQFRTRTELSPYILQLKKKTPAKLSKAALETLAVIAYRQPVLRAEIEKIRGVDAGGVIKILLEKDLIHISSRRESLPGKPMLYSTTQRFLEIFDLPNLAALPTIEEIEKLCPPPLPRLF
jgi:segregation and condensation protein B